jgi:haloacetate dehalogenase
VVGQPAISRLGTEPASYGASDKPTGSEGHEEYSKREMANDQVQVMCATPVSHCDHTQTLRSDDLVRTHFGFDSFYLMAHDRGARVAHRLALDHPDKIKKMILLDIAPTLWMYEHTNMEFVSVTATTGPGGA